MSADTADVQSSKTDSSTQRVYKNPIVIQSMLKQLYVDKDETGDVAFIIGSERIYAHRCVLAAISSKYKTQFYGSQPDKGDIKVVGSTASAFRKFIEFFYLEEILLTTENIEEVLDLAKQSLVDEFIESCVDFLTEVASLGNLCLCYRLAILYGIEELQELCETLIKKDTQKIFKSVDFINCDRNLLLHILKLDSLSCEETEVFDACISWAKAACNQKNVDAEKSENLRIELDEAITQIRFGSMTMEEFVVRDSSYSGLFSHEESKDIFYLIGRLKDFKSEKFNQKPRNSRNSRRYLECNRVLSYRPFDRFVEYVMGSWLNFACNHSIRFEGFTLGCYDYKSMCTLLVTVDGRHQMPKCSSKVNKEKKETTITFDEPLDVNPNERVQILFDIDKCHMSTRYKLATKVTLDKLIFDIMINPEDFFVTKLLYTLG